ncbi:hypothetical protein OH76DRAFT_1412347 [Lentinus brumalis]|uniref:Uncharacterized protein n=1 Tax=Lentinus brumalis TaxID=2498619 RepID=A0A371CLI2_9APHY|nr:hypothetical protein OH76DRAFT_1412347 [Polyporus brumalis]
MVPTILTTLFCARMDISSPSSSSSGASMPAAASASVASTMASPRRTAPSLRCVSTDGSLHEHGLERGSADRDHDGDTTACRI